MKKTAVIGVTHDGKTELLAGVDLYSNSLRSAIPLRKGARFAEVWVAGPIKRYRLKAPQEVVEATQTAKSDPVAIVATVQPGAELEVGSAPRKAKVR